MWSNGSEPHFLCGSAFSLRGHYNFKKRGNEEAKLSVLTGTLKIEEGFCNTSSSAKIRLPEPFPILTNSRSQRHYYNGSLRSS